MVELTSGSSGNSDLTREWKATSKNLFKEDVSAELADNLNIQPLRPFPTISSFVTGEMKLDSLDAAYDPAELEKLNREVDSILVQYIEQGTVFFKHLEDPDLALLDLLFLKAFY